MTRETGGKLFALIPAAGRSRRMGRPKLLLKLGETTVIRRLIQVLKSSGVNQIVVLVRRDDLDLQKELKSLNCECVIAKHDPPEMRDSVELLVQYLTVKHAPGEGDHWLLIPADHPFVEAATVEHLIEVAGRFPDKIVLPVFLGKRGHPTLFPWSMAREVAQIPSSKGLNWLVRRDPGRVVEVEMREESVLFDLDTPEDFEKAAQSI